MNPRTTGILFLVALVLGAFVYFYEIRGEDARREAEEAEKRLFPGLEPEDVAWIEIPLEGGGAARVERAEDEGWRLVQPLVFPADEFTADGMASALARLQSEQVIESPQADDVYGLDAGRRIRFGAGDEEHALRIGDKTPIGGNSYVRVADREPVYAVPTYSTTALVKNVTELRDKRVLHFDREAIRRIRVDWPGGGVTLVRGDGGWRLQAPLEARADETSVDELLADLAFLRAEGFVDDPPTPAESGLAQPDLRVVLETGEEGDEDAPRFEMEVGAPLADGMRRVRTASRDSLYRIAAERIQDFPRSVVAYRFKQLAEFVSTDAERLEMELRGPEGAITVTARRDEAGWSSEPVEIEAGKLGRILSELSRLRAEDVLADAMGPDEMAGVGLSPPRAAFRVYGRDDEADPDAEPSLLAEVHLGEIRGDAHIVARTPGLDPVFLVDYALAEYLPVNRSAFENRFAAQPEAGEEPAEESEPPAADAPEAGAPAPPEP